MHYQAEEYDADHEMDAGDDMEVDDEPIHEPPLFVHGYQGGRFSI